MNERPKSRLRLIKVAVQPFFVLDDGETITELEHQVTVIPASEWPTYSSERFPREVAEWQARLDAGETARESRRVAKAQA